MKINKLNYLKALTIFLVFFVVSKVNAAGTFSVSTNKTSLKPGETAIVTIKTNNCAGKFGITSSNTGVLAVSTRSTWVDGTVTVTVTAKANGTANITVNPIDVSDNDLNDVKGSKSVSIKVATPQTTTTPSTSSNKTTGTTKPSTSKTNTTTKPVSNNAYLKEFRVDKPGISPSFNKNTFNYSITVDESVDKLNVTAVPENSKASVSITGNTGLKTGDNVITVKVVAEDKKTSKVYKIFVTKTDDEAKSNAYLQNLIVSNMTLTPEFSKEVFEYSLGDISYDVEKLEISAFPVNEKAKVEITGNDKLVVNENTIKIAVTSENSKVQKVYTLNVNKKEGVSKDENKQVENKDKEEESMLVDKWSNVKRALKEKAPILWLYAFVWIEFLQVVYLYEKLKKKDNTIHIK